MNIGRFDKQQNDCVSSSGSGQGRANGLSRILMVEDDDLVRAALTRRLTRLGYAVVGVSNANDAIATLAAGVAFDYLLTDIMLTGPVTGTMLATHVRGRWPTIKIVLMTGYQEFTVPDTVT